MSETNGNSTTEPFIPDDSNGGGGFGWEDEEEDEYERVDQGEYPNAEPTLFDRIGDDAFEVEDTEPHYEDEPKNMTWGRLFARVLSGKYGWYNPQAKARDEYEAAQLSTEEATDGGSEPKRKPPSLDAAWAYFEHVVLPRHFVKGSSPTSRRQSFVDRRNTKDVQERAEPGETHYPTRLYSIWGTPESQLADFGIGVGIYFNTLKILSAICFIAGLINLPTMLFYSSSEYAQNEQSSISNDLLKGSAVCTDTSWSACPTCTKDDWDRYPSTHDRFASTEDGLAFILVNHCNIEEKAGFASWATFLFVFIAIYAMGFFSRKKEVAFDEAQQTTTDYSIEVENPPKDARDPDEWREFFSQFGEECHVTCCTIALDNEDLIRALAERRKALLTLELMCPPDIEFDKGNLDDVVCCIPGLPFWKRLMCMSDAPTLLRKIRDLDQKIDELSNKTYEVSNVFITFETERAQRNVLASLAVRHWDVWTNNNSALPDEMLFRGNLVLAVREPSEPSSIRWQDLDESVMTKVLQSLLTGIICSCCIVGSAVLIALARRDSPFAAAITITCLNTVTPMVVRFISRFQSHSSEGSKQADQYTKITLFRWINTAIVTTIITPFTDTLSNGSEFLIHSIYAIFVTEMVKTPLMQVLDIWGNIKRHYFGPRSVDQKRMNLNFTGTRYELSERYTDMTKVLFLTLFYSALFPAGWFFASVTLAVHYWTDKFCLLRQWSPAPMMGSDIAVVSRNYFFTAALLAFAVMASYNLALFPYDNACETGVEVEDDYLAVTKAKTGEGDEISVSISPGDKEYVYCNQNMFTYRDPPAFPALPTFQREEWMTPEQEQVVRIYAWTSVAALAAVSVIFFNRIFISLFRKIFYKRFQTRGRAMDERFSDVKEIFGYVPQIKLPQHPFPLIACDIRGIDLGLIGWRDPYHSYDYHNMIFDVPRVAKWIAAAQEAEAAVEEAGSGETVNVEMVASVEEEEQEEVEVVSNTPQESNGHDETEKDIEIFSIIKNWPPPSN